MTALPRGLDLEAQLAGLLSKQYDAGETAVHAVEEDRAERVAPRLREAIEEVERDLRAQETDAGERAVREAAVRRLLAPLRALLAELEVRS